tara:strand:+ start:3539 stop:4816 length:1278 start_codon:yes stop_codon:yes gene_type:complete
MLSKLNKSNYLIQLLMLFLILIFVLGRAFIGISIFGFRIGELIVAFSLLLSLGAFIDSQFRKSTINRLIKIHLGFVITFIIITILTNSSFFESYTYKSSSYIWTIGYLYFGYIFFKHYKFNTFHLNTLIFVTVLVYFNEISRRIFSPNFLVEFLTAYSDKPLQNHKGYDLIMVFVVSTFIFLKKMHYKRLTLDIFVLISALYLPLIVWKSKGATLGFVFYVISQLIYHSDKLRKNLFRNIILLILAVLVVFISSVGMTYYESYEVPNEDAIEFVLDHKFSNNNWLFLYIVDGRIYSDDGNANWRLQIWQDVIHDSIQNKTYIYGMGYKDKIPAMDDPKRSGRDGKNENVHNFLINNYARGGIVHLFLTVFFFGLILFKRDAKDWSRLIFAMPFLITSFFGASMESAHFPAVYYFFLASFFTDSFD